jgi:plasmid replication initiation protein
MSASALRAIMKAKSAFKSRWVKVFKHYKLQGKSPVEAKELANRMLGVY